MEKLISNYHTHTYRCGHALPNPDIDYVNKAIELGYKNLGFSDHAPLKGIHHLSMRMDFEKDFPGYISSIRSLEEEFKGKINIKLGLEIEYYSDRDDYYKELLNDYHLDYLILGQHLRYDSNGDMDLYWRHIDDFEGIKRYVDDLILGINSGHFTYVCHPDLFLNHVKSLTPEVLKMFEDICLAAKKMNLPLEININGDTNNKYWALKHGCYHYPSVEFFRVAKKIGNRFIFGVDAHAPWDFDKINYPYFDEFLKETGITSSDILTELPF